MERRGFFGALAALPLVAVVLGRAKPQDTQPCTCSRCGKRTDPYEEDVNQIGIGAGRDSTQGSFAHMRGAGFHCNTQGIALRGGKGRGVILCWDCFEDNLTS